MKRKKHSRPITFRFFLKILCIAWIQQYLPTQRISNNLFNWQLAFDYIITTYCLNRNYIEEFDVLIELIHLNFGSRELDTGKDN